jgi:uncharacterized protein (TIGR02099 family)
MLKFSERSGEFAFASAPTVVANLKSAVTKKDRGHEAKSEPVKRVPLVLDFGEMFPAAMNLGAITGALEWKRLNEAIAAVGTTPAKPPVWQVRTDGVTVESEDVKGKFVGTWQNDELGPGIAKISGKIERANATAIPKYLPNTVANTRRWLQNSILEGRVGNVDAALEGALWHFPFRDSKFGKFEIVAPVNDVSLNYGDGWPSAENIDGTLTFRNASMSAAVNRATIAGATLGATQVQIADLGSGSPLLEIRGSASASIEQFLRFIEKSPVNRMLDQFTEGAKGTGNGRLNLGLAIPLADFEKTKVDGEFSFDQNQIALGKEIPTLENVSGRLRFTEQEVRAKEISATALGGPVSINVMTENGIIKTNASGRGVMARVRERYEYPLLDQITGDLNWSMDMQVARNSSEGNALRVNGTLAPQALPIDRVFQASATPRNVSQPIAFSFVRTALSQGRDRIEFELPSQLHAILERSAERVSEGRTVERAVVDLGAQKTQLPLRGYSIRGELAKLNTDAALALLPAISGSSAKNVGGVKTESATADFVNVSVRADRAIVFSHVLNDASLRAQPSGQRWRLALRSKEASGIISVDRSAEGAGDVDAVVVRLQRFAWPSPMTESDALVSSAKANATTSEIASSQKQWPKLDLIAESFASDGRDLGRLEVKAQPGRNEWQIESVKLTNPDGSIAAKGRWQLPSGTAAATAINSGRARVGETSVEVALDWKDAGRFMQRFGLPKGVERGEGELRGELKWSGSPASFAYEALDGKFTLKTGGGRFSEMEPGIAKLLGVISLQSIPRRLTFNFDDLFGRGFAFDSIVADVAIASGKASTDAFDIVGPAARVEIRGSANLIAETTQLRVRVFPSVSVATAIGVGLATANPAIGAAAWLGQKIARDPVERLLMQEFDVSGAWANPEVKQTRGMGSETTDPNRSTAGTK